MVKEVIPIESSNNEPAPWHNDLFKTPSKYKSKDLYEWHHPPIVVAKDPNGYGEMGKQMLSSIYKHDENKRL